MNLPPDLISPLEAAEIRGVSKQAINYLMDNNRLPVYWLGGRRYLSRREVVALERLKPGPKAGTKKGKK